jgi:hypothetical protein
MLAKPMFGVAPTPGRFVSIGPGTLVAGMLISS